MANPFKEQQRRATPNVRAVEPTVQEEPVQEEQPVVKNDDLLAGLKPKKPVAKTYGFYLDDDVVAAIDKLAKQTHTSKSKVLNTLLRNALLNK